MTIPDRGAFSGLTPDTKAQRKIEDEALLDAARQIPGAGVPWQTATIAGGAIAIGAGSSGLIDVAGEGSGADDLVTITASLWDEGTIVILRANSDAITVKSTGNITLKGGDFVMRTTTAYLLLVRSASGFSELFRFVDWNDPTSAAEARAYAGLEIGVDIQEYNANYVRKDLASAFTRQQYFTRQALTYGGTINWNLTTAQSAVVTLTGATAQLANPSNPQTGGVYEIVIVQDATGGRNLTFGTDYRWASGNAPPISSMAANEMMKLVFSYRGTRMLGSFDGPYAA